MTIAGHGPAMDAVAEQYEAYPYPERDPADEARRLIVGSPSNPVEIDHFCFAGRRDWSQPFDALVAGGGTGDALVMLAQKLADAKVPHSLTYLDRSTASRAVAEARIAARGLSRAVRFVSGDLADAVDLGRFDYIDCCGVLHHLPEPQAGFDALAAALKPGGGMGAMVYAPYGRTGVYPLQAALATLTRGLDPAGKVARARAVLDALPPSNWLRRNDLLGDHERGDAGLYDLLLHARDTPFTADAVIGAVEAAGLRFAGWLQPARYDPATWIANPPRDLTPAQAAALAEQLAGGIRAHVFYAVRDAAGCAPAAPALTPRLQGLTAAQLSGAAGRSVAFTIDGVKHRVSPPASARRMLALLDGRRTLGAVAQASGMDWIAFMAAHGALLRRLTGVGALLYSARFV
jgi:SAM-dependent methyltransferase